MARRLKAMGLPQYQDVVDDYGWTGDVSVNETAFNKLPKKHQVVFLVSMGDLFYADKDTVQGVLEVAGSYPQHTFRVCTKRPQAAYQMHLVWPVNVQLGVTVESHKYMWRVDVLHEIPVQSRFINCEPLLGPIPDLELNGIHWVAAGYETGPHARVGNPDWIHDVAAQCYEQKVPFLFKEWGVTDPGPRGTPHDLGILPE
jgi:protein gp37